MVEKRKFLGIYFDCCHVYGRVYKNKEGTAYEGWCPKCRRIVHGKVAPIKDFLEQDSLKGYNKMESLICLFCMLAKIPSPSLQEQLVAEKIIQTFHELQIDSRQDAYGNVYANIPATDETKQPIMLSAHMDVVGDSSPVNIVYSEDKKFIETDKTRTLGADDKKDDIYEKNKI